MNILEWERVDKYIGTGCRLILDIYRYRYDLFDESTFKLQIYNTNYIQSDAKAQ